MLQVKLTFKESEKWIYDEIMKHASKSGWVKDVLAEYIRNQKPSQPTNDFNIFQDFK